MGKKAFGVDGKNMPKQDVVVKPKDRFICMGTVLGKVQGMPDL